MRCLIVDDVHPVLIRSLESIGHTVIYRPDFDLASESSLLQAAEILVIRSRFWVTEEVFNQAPDLKILARAGAGLDIVDLEAAEAFGVQVLHAAEGNADAVAEHTIGLILGLLSRIASGDRSVKAGNWNREGFRGLEIKGKTVGILGYGNMGRAVASRLVSFGCKLISYDKYLAEWPDNNAQRVDLETLQSESEILSLHLPLSEETKGWVDQKFLRKCRKGLFLINTSRGAIVPIQPLADLLEGGFLGGVGLDVLEDEPPLKKNALTSQKYERLFGRNDVLLTPHVAGWSLESYERISKVLFDKIVASLVQPEI